MDFDEFLTRFFGEIAKDSFYQGKSLTDYLNRPAGQRGGDEADIVDDKISRALIEALGYETGEIEYNRAGDGGKRPDFKVEIQNYPRPCFIVEDKNTTTEKLEPNLTQLEGYMRSRGAPRGILTDGKRLLAYDLADPTPVTTSDISLFNLVKAWRGEGIYGGGDKGKDNLPQDELLKIRAFWARFSKDAYVGSVTLVEELTKTTDGDWHAVDGSTWPDKSLIQPFRQAGEDGFLDSLIKDTRALIKDIQLDVEAQLTLRLEEFDTYQAALDRLPDREGDESVKDLFTTNLNSVLSELRKVGLHSETVRSVQFHLESQLERFTERNLVAGLGGRIRDQINTLRQQQAQSEKVYDDGSEAVPLEGFEVKDPNILLEAPKVKPKKFTPIKELPSGIESSLKRLQDLLTSYHEHREDLLTRYKPALEVQRAFETWREKVATLLIRTDDLGRLRKEFAAQTSYVLIVRLLLIRIAEDKGLLERVFTNGGLSLWFRHVEPRYLKYAQGRGTDYLLEMAYASAQHIYAHFYDERLLYDWYKPDRNLVIRVLHRLAGYDLSQIDHDVIGHVYSGYVQDEHKHESGMYYTPPEVVDYILDRLGYAGPEIIGKKILDPASGSGTFLVSAARRLVQAFRDYYKSQGHSDVPVDEIQTVINEVKKSIYGLDLNPFACYLAETNLLIQVLDLIKRALDAGVAVNVDRFNIHNTDTLRYGPKTIGVTKGTLQFPADELPVPEQIKAKVGEFAEGFDFVVANPPYVRADEGGEGLLRYRADVKAEHPIAEVANVLKLKWDLFVPFVALGWYLLKDGGKVGMITSDAIEAVPYTEALRGFLVENAIIDELSFFPNVKLFEDAVVENTVFFMTHSAPDANHETLQRWHDGLPPRVAKEEKLKQLEQGVNVFRQTVSKLSTEDTVKLNDVCYVSVGMVLNADEKRYPSAFKKDELLSPVKTATNVAAYVEGKDIECYEVTSISYLEYGEGLRAPEMIRRQTFPELYDRPKLIAQRSVSSGNNDVSQVVMDLGDWDGYLRTNESGVVVMPWHSLKGVGNRSIGGADEPNRKKGERLSEGFALSYLVGVLNSKTVSDYLRATRRHKIHIFPDDFKAIPIPVADTSTQQPIADKAKELHELGKSFSSLRKSGWQLNTEKKEVKAVGKLPNGISKLALSSAKVRWSLNVLDADADVTELNARGTSLYRGRAEVLRLPSGTSERATEWLKRQLATLEPGTTFRIAEARGMEIPASPADAEKALAELEKQEAEVKEKIEDFHKLRAEVDELVAELYEPK